MKVFNTALSLSLISFCLVGQAAPIMVVTPNALTLTVNSQGSGALGYTVQNKTQSKGIHTITIDPAFGGGNAAGMSVPASTNTCLNYTSANPLPAGQSCTFNVYIDGTNQPANYLLSPKVCIFDGATCSQPQQATRVTMTTVPATPRGTAYLALTTGVNANTIQPLNVPSNTLGTPINGLCFTEGSCPMTESSPPISHYPIGSFMSNNLKTLYMTEPFYYTIASINLTANPPTLSRFELCPGSKSLAPCPAPSSLAAQQDNSYLYVGSFNSPTIIRLTGSGAYAGEVYLCEVPKNQITGPSCSITTDYVSLNPAGTQIFASSPATNELFVIDSYSGDIITEVNSQNECLTTEDERTRPCKAASSYTPFQTPYTTAFTPDGTKFFVCSNNCDQLYVFNAVTFDFITSVYSPYDFKRDVKQKTAATLLSCDGLAVSSDGSTVYVSSPGYGLWTYNTQTNATTGITYAPLSCAVSLNSDGSFLYATQIDDTDVVVVNTKDLSFTTAPVGGEQPMVGTFIQ